MLETDWERAIRHGVGEYIVKVDDEGDVSEIDEARDALMMHVKLVYSAWDYLCALGGGGSSVLSIGSNSFAAFIKEAKLADPAATNCKQSHLDQLFILINSQHERPAPTKDGTASSNTKSVASASAGSAPSWGTLKIVSKVTATARMSTGSARTFERHEWLHALVRIAIMRYVLPGERSVPMVSDVSDAIEVGCTAT